MSINLNQLTAEINKTLRHYASGITEDVAEISEEAGKEGLKMIKERSPTLTESYKKGWRLKKQGKAYVIHNKTDYQLIHLLENGHVNAAGTGRVDAIPHVEPTEREIIEEFERRVEALFQ